MRRPGRAEAPNRPLTSDELRGPWTARLPSMAESKAAPTFEQLAAKIAGRQHKEPAGQTYTGAELLDRIWGRGDRR